MPAHRFITRRTLVQRSLAGVAGLWLATHFPQAQANTAVRFILPLSAGSGVDAIARSASQALSEALGGKAVVVDNQPGAGGVIGTQGIVRAAPDGATLGFVSNNHVIFPSVVKNLSFDPVADITPISIVCTSPLLLVARADFPANNLQELQALLKKSPDTYNFGSSGNGTILHLAAEQFLQLTGTQSTHVPYRGTGPLVADMIGGQVDWGVIALPAIRGQLEAGRLKVLASCTPEPIASFPNIPTAIQQGYPDYVVEGWVAVVGPKGLSQDTVDQMYTALKHAYQQPSVMEAMDKQGNTVTLHPPAYTREYIASERQKYDVLAKNAGLTPQ
ncbi:tripartite tricarboxylate transporter substrate binding protein [Lampropedia aestuarii]|uniref:Tripartite tricarboxylate transporter substrate binding protein n=1 Tax=Lampropedia aestuarii TaxID=2562762 RepID=A0A4V3YWB5_9BURK|nr:tripartite tricarboxylate transporter substrate binding protein [Lampropedia aestuarii]THJ30692.1 tripartite tricarboxylate transporter substrate binding protein [Lampropedia aestuarii]